MIYPISGQRPVKNSAITWKMASLSLNMRLKKSNTNSRHQIPHKLGKTQFFLIRFYGQYSSMLLDYMNIFVRVEKCLSVLLLSAVVPLMTSRRGLAK